MHELYYKKNLLANNKYIYNWPKIYQFPTLFHSPLSKKEVTYNHNNRIKKTQTHCPSLMVTYGPSMKFYIIL